ncbi:MAG TPA: hypothetical protein ENI64_13360 [Gammaproteobacteria bacterium]|nr:hypothetical protein [Gammaproteobacteria bacterium]
MWHDPALKPGSKCSFTPVNCAFSPDFALSRTHLSEFTTLQEPVGLTAHLLPVRLHHPSSPQTARGWFRPA